MPISPKTLTPGVQYWSATEAAALHRGWVLGSFMEKVENHPPFEVKYSTHQKGELRDWTETDSSVTGATFAIIIAGCMRQYYRDSNGVEHSKDFRAGEVFLAKNDIPHRWICLEDDTVLVAVRCN